MIQFYNFQINIRYLRCTGILFFFTQGYLTYLGSHTSM